MDADSKALVLPPTTIASLTSSHSTLAGLLSSIPEDHTVGDNDEIFDEELSRTTAGSSSESTGEQKILQLLRQSLLPFSDRLDPFAALPVSLSRFQEHLVTFYLLYYPKVTYGFSPGLQPHPVATNFSIALSTPACFQVILARSALYRLSLSKYAGESQKHDLELAMMRHKGEALKQIRLLNAKPPSPARKDDLIASIISIGTLDRRTGDSKTSGMHYMAVRRILKATGGPLAVKSLLLSRVMVFFECIYGTSPESYIWDSTDLKGLTYGVNQFLDKTWKLWKAISSSPYLRPKGSASAAPGSAGPMSGTSSTTSQATARGQDFYLTAGTPLHTILTRSPIPPDAADQEPNPLQRLELITQLTCLLTLAGLFVDHITELRYAALTMAILDLNRAITKLCPQKRPPGSGKVPLLHRAGSSKDSNPTTESTTSSPEEVPSGSMPPPSTYPSNTSRSRAPAPPSAPGPSKPTTSPLSASAHRPIAPAPGDANAAVPPSPSANNAKPPLTTHHSSSTSTPSAPPPSVQIDTSGINASNIMWILHITDHSSEHTRRIWTGAAYAWVAKHLGWNVQKRWKEWLVRFLEGQSVFVDDDDGDDTAAGGGNDEQGAEMGAKKLDEAVDVDVKGKQRERWTVERSGSGSATAAAAAEGASSSMSPPKKKTRKMKEKPFKLDAWAFSYAS